MVGSSSRTISQRRPAAVKPRDRWAGGHRPPVRAFVVAVQDLQGGDDAQVERRLADWLTGKYRPGGLVTLTHEGRNACLPHQSRMEEMDHTPTERNIDPALDQLRICLAVTVFDNPVS